MTLTRCVPSAGWSVLELFVGPLGSIRIDAREGRISLSWDFWQQKESPCVCSQLHHSNERDLGAELQRSMAMWKALWAAIQFWVKNKFSGEKNYDAECPDGWKRLSSSVCSAPATYQGPCGSGPLKRSDSRKYVSADLKNRSLRLINHFEFYSRNVVKSRFHAAAGGQTVNLITPSCVQLTGPRWLRTTAAW